MIRCQSRIKMEYKTVKADCFWPHYQGAELLPRCGGEVKITVELKYEPDYRGGAYAVFDIQFSCSRCKFPYFIGMESLKIDPEGELAKAAELYYSEKQ
jgi:hypothetical protein